LSAGAIQRLQQNNLLTADAIDKADETAIKDLIYPVCVLMTTRTDEGKLSCFTETFSI
jgi:hypothetical protein